MLRLAWRSLARWIGWLLAFAAALALLLYLVRDPLHQVLADTTGEEDWSFQLRALGLLALSFAQPAHDTADFAPVRYDGWPPFGVNTFLEQEVEETKLRQSLALIRDAGFTWVRQEFPWEDLEQAGKGQFWDAKFNHSTWDKYDRIVNLAHEYGLQLVVRLDHPPPWTRRDGRARGDFAPADNLDDYGDFVATVVARYRGRVRFYQLWNEPNIYPEWGEQPVDAGAYTKLLKAGSARARAADPGALILSAGLAQTVETGPKNQSDLTFLEQMYAAGARDSFDILAVQDYGLFSGPGDHRLEPGRTNFSRPVLLREIMVAHGDAAKPVWAMEVGWNAAPASIDPIYGRVTEQQQARYAVQAYQRARDEWPWMGPMMYWFFKRADAHEQDQPFYFFRMFEPDFSPHPVYAALEQYMLSARLVSRGYHPVDHWAVDKRGDWKVVPDLTVPFGEFVVGQPGAVLSFNWRGSALALSSANPYSGRVQAVVDGRDLGEFDLRESDPGVERGISLISGLSPDNHTAMVLVTEGPVNLLGVLIDRHWEPNGFQALGGGSVLILLGGVGAGLARRRRLRQRARS